MIFSCGPGLLATAGRYRLCCLTNNSAEFGANEDLTGDEFECNY